MDTLNILCLGDSLTQGWYGPDMERIAYGDSLERYLNEVLPDTKTHVVSEGRPGDRVGATGSFDTRLEMLDAKDPFDWVIILGGTNDLAYPWDATAIYERLKSLYVTCTEYGAKVLALTIPETARQSASIVARRNAVNKCIMDREGDGFYAFDFHALMPYHSLDEHDKKSRWEDGLHFTPFGYDRMAMLVGERLVQIMKEVGPDAAKNASKV